MKTEKEEIQREAIKKLDDSRSDLRILTDFKEETELLKLSRKETTLPQIVIQKGIINQQLMYHFMLLKYG